MLVQAAPTIAETLFLLELASEHAFIAGVVGWVDFESPMAAESIGTLAADSKLVGLRPMIQDIPDIAWMLKPGLAPAIEAMIDHDLVFDALLLPKHLPVLLDFAEMYPELRLVVDHGAKPQIRVATSPNGGMTSRRWRAAPMPCARSPAWSPRPAARIPRSSLPVSITCWKYSVRAASCGAATGRCANWSARTMSGTRPARCCWSGSTSNGREQIYSGTARATYGI